MKILGGLVVCAGILSLAMGTLNGSISGALVVVGLTLLLPGLRTGRESWYSQKSRELGIDQGYDRNRFRRRFALVISVPMLLASVALVLHRKMEDARERSPERVQMRENQRLAEEARRERESRASEHFQAAEAHFQHAIALDAAKEKKAAELQQALSEVSEAQELHSQPQHLELQALVLGHLGQYDEGGKVFQRALQEGSKNLTYIELLRERRQNELALSIVDEQLRMKKPCDLQRLRLNLLLDLGRGIEAVNMVGDIRNCFKGSEYEEFRLKAEAVAEKEIDMRRER